MGLDVPNAMPQITTPHPDLELGYPRQPLNYSVVLPDGGVGERTGMIFYIFGFGSSYDDSYAQKLLPYLANDHDCVAVAVDYHGAEAQKNLELRFAPDFFVNLRQHHGVTVSVAPDMDERLFRLSLFSALVESGLNELHESCRLIKQGVSYINFGVLSALDLLQVAAKVMAEYDINHRRIFAIGSSYGGYLALLLTKLAPNTFRFVVDNCGYSGAADAGGVIYGLTSLSGPLRVLLISPQAFRIDPASPAYFNPTRQAIRELAIPDHYQLPSATMAYSYHGQVDNVASPEAKAAVSACLRQNGRHHDLRFIGPADLDGHLFKVPEHGLQASMRGLMRLSMERWLADAPQDVPALTDFDLGTINILACADFDYMFTFGQDGVRLTIC